MIANLQVFGLMDNHTANKKPFGSEAFQSL